MLNRKVLASIFLVLLAFKNLAFSEPFHDRREEGRREMVRDSWHGDIRYFHAHDIDRWRAGHWVNAWHGGRRAYWWVVGGVWYAYPVPVYPYPDPLIPSVMIEQNPSANASAGSPPVEQPVQTQAPQFWYYCQNPTGYYPYVPECQGGWQKVPATPPSP